MRIGKKTKLKFTEHLRTFGHGTMSDYCSDSLLLYSGQHPSLLLLFNKTHLFQGSCATWPLPTCAFPTPAGPGETAAVKGKILSLGGHVKTEGADVSRMM